MVVKMETDQLSTASLEITGSITRIVLPVNVLLTAKYRTPAARHQDNMPSLVITPVRVGGWCTLSPAHCARTKNNMSDRQFAVWPKDTGTTAQKYVRLRMDLGHIFMPIWWTWVSTLEWTTTSRTSSRTCNSPSSPVSTQTHLGHRRG